MDREKEERKEDEEEREYEDEEGMLIHMHRPHQRGGEMCPGRRQTLTGHKQLPETRLRHIVPLTLCPANRNDTQSTLGETSGCASVAPSQLPRRSDSPEPLRRLARWAWRPVSCPG